MVLKSTSSTHTILSDQIGAAVAEASAVLLWIANTEKQCIYFNKAWLRYRGRTLEEEYGYGWADGVHKDDFDRCLEIYTTAFDARNAFTMDYRLQKANGDYGWIRDDGVPFYDSEGVFKGYIGSCFDITETMELLAELASEQNKLIDTNIRFRAAVDAGNIGVWDWDTVNNVLIWDEKMYEMYGLENTGAQETFSLWQNALCEEDSTLAVNAVNEALQGIKPYDIDFNIILPNGDKRIISAQAKVFRDADGKPLRMIGTNVDVTDARKSERRIADLKKRNQALLDYSPACHKIIDLDFKLRYMNRTAFLILGIPLDTPIKGEPYPFSFLPDDIKASITENLNIAKAEKRAVCFEGPALDANGKELWLLHNIIPVFKDDSDELDYLTVVSSDLTQQREIQEQLKHREKMDAIGQLAGGVAHDFNNQLACILGYAQLVQTLDISDKAKQYIEKITESAERSAKLTKQMLAYSRKQKLAAEPTSIHKDILDTIDLISHSVDKRIVFNTSFNAQRDVVMGEKSFLQSAFLNLAKNASDAMSNGGVLTISTENVWSRDSQRLASEPDKKVGEYIKISFRDTGCGISVENQTKIFEPFFTTKAIGAGTGMGLPSVYGTIKSHSGFIYLESELGVGTEFILYLPIADQNYTKIFSAETNPISTGQANAKKILVVDDEVQLREIYFDLLTSSGYEIVLAENGKDAIEKYRDQYTTLDLIILDLAMPVMDGSDAYDVIKQINPNAKVIVSSGYNSHESLNSIKTKGINDVIEKPFTLSELVTIVKKVLDS